MEMPKFSQDNFQEGRVDQARDKVSRERYKREKIEKLTKELLGSFEEIEKINERLKSPDLSPETKEAEGSFKEDFTNSAKRHIDELSLLLSEDIAMHENYLKLTERRLAEAKDEQAKKDWQESVDAEKGAIVKIEDKLSGYRGTLNSLNTIN